MRCIFFTELSKMQANPHPIANNSRTLYAVIWNNWTCDDRT